MFSNLPAALGDRYRRFLSWLPAGVRNAISRSADSWTCGCGQAHRYEPSRADSATTLTVTCPECHRTAMLRAAGRRANTDLQVQGKVGVPGRRIASKCHQFRGAAASFGSTS